MLVCGVESEHFRESGKLVHSARLAGTFNSSYEGSLCEEICLLARDEHDSFPQAVQEDPYVFIGPQV